MRVADVGDVVVGVEVASAVLVVEAVPAAAADVQGSAVAEPQASRGVRAGLRRGPRTPYAVAP